MRYRWYQTMVFTTRSSLRNKLFLWLCCLASAGMAQKVKNVSPVYTTGKNMLLLEDTLRKVDSTLTGFQNYYPYDFIQDLGNLTSPAQYRFLTFQENAGLRTGWSTPAFYHLTDKDTRYYKASVPYTMAYYGSGQRPSNYFDYLQQVQLLHTQNWGPLFNIGVDIHSNRCNGFSTNAQSRTGSGQIFAWFHSPDKRYQALATATFSSASSQVNGGISNDSLFEATSGITKEANGFITDSSLFRSRSQVYTFSHFYRIGPVRTEVTTRQVRRDSVAIDTLRTVDASLQLAQKISWSGISWLYTDNIKPSFNYFRYYYFDTLRTKDSLHQSLLAHTLDVTKKLNRNGIINAGLETRLHWLAMYKANMLVHEEIVHGLLKQNIPLKKDSLTFLRFQAKADYVLFSNYAALTQHDYTLQAGVGVSIPGGTADIKAYSSAQAPTLMQTYFPGNHFYYYNGDLRKTFTNGLYLDLFRRGLASLQATAAVVSNHTFFTYDSILHVNQADPLTYASVRWKQQYRWASLLYVHHVMYQVTSNSAALPVPTWLYKGSLMYDADWFKKALHIQFGVSMNYFSKYNAPAFLPSALVYYNQQQKVIGNYPQLDGFVNLQIQRVRIFLMMEHFNEDMNGFPRGAYATPHYPLTRRAIRFGVSWSFYN